MTKIAHFRWWIASLLFIATGLSFFDRQVLSTLAPAITHDLHIDDVTYSHVVSAFILSYTVMFTVGGRLIDWLGLRVGLALSVGLWTLASLLHGISRGPLALGFFRFLLGAGEGGCFPGSTKGAIEWFPRQERAVAVGFANGGSAFGAVVAPPVTVWMSMRFGWRGAFFATGAMGVLWLIAWLVFFRLPQESGFVSKEELRRITQGRDEIDTGAESMSFRSVSRRRGILPWSSAAPMSPSEDRNLVTPQSEIPRSARNDNGYTNAPPAEALVPWQRLLRMKEVWGLMATRFLLDPVFYFYMFWIPQYLSQTRHVSLAAIGNLTWVPFMTLGVSTIAGGWASDHLVRSGWTINAARKTMLGLGASLTPFSILCVFVSGPGLAVALMSVLMFAHGFWISNYMTVIGDLFPIRAVGSVAGVSGSAGGVGGILSSLIVGLVAQYGSYSPLFMACGLLYPIGFAVILLTIPRIRPLEFGTTE
jgi:ACS family hexuronate transporter-like MFS transporter